MTITPELAAQILGVLTGIGVILPHVQALLQKRSWSPRTKAILTVAWSVLAGAVAQVTTAGIPTDLTDFTGLGLWIAGAWSASSLAYGRLWKHTGTTDALENAAIKDRDHPGPEFVPPYVDLDEQPADGAQPVG